MNNPVGVPEAALHFNGSSTHIDTSNSVLCNFTNNPFTINFWLYSMTPAGYLMGNNSSLTNGWFIYVTDYHLRFGSEASGSESSIYTTKQPYGGPFGAW